MTVLPTATRRYLDKSAIQGPWVLAGNQADGFSGAVVIPALAEGKSLFATLQSLAANPLEWLTHFLVVIVVNHAEQASAATKQQNAIDLIRLAEFAKRSQLCLSWIDAAGSGCEVADKQAGVGFARKLGMDLALSRLNWSEDPLLVCLDADTLVERNYLQTIAAHFRRSKSGATVLPYQHQAGTDAEQQEAIERYELFLRSYVFGLRLAGSPYAFNSLGSAMACRATAYVRCGGMNCRKAAEDFYFLQKLAKTDGVDRLSGTRVFPEPRVSERVPFGTGRSMGRLLDGDTRGVLFYPAAAFRIVAEWLHVVEQRLDEDHETLSTQAQQISALLADYLEQIGWRTVWPRLQSTHGTAARRLQAFHIWFDGFRTMRLIHLLCEAGLKRGEPEDLLPDYFAWDGRPCPSGQTEMLQRLRLQDDG